MKIPAQLAKAVRARWPDRADDWLTHLEPELVELCHRFSAIPQRVLPARYALVIAAATPDGSLIMRATPDPDGLGQTSVAAMLGQLGIAPAIHAVHTTATGIWTVMEHITPGIPLADIDPQTLDLDELAAPLRRMTDRSAPTDDLPRLDEWLRHRLTDDHLTDLPLGETSASQTERKHALTMLDELTADAHMGLCHGDTSPWNILTDHDRGWVLIDPRGICGQVEYDAAVLALKLAHIKALPAATTRLVDAAQLDQQRVHAWEIVARAARV